MINLFGSLGAILFAICALPQVYQVWKTQETKSISLLFLLCWAGGEICMWIYVGLYNYSTGIIQYPLHFNYFFNALSLAYLLYKKLTETK